MNPLPELPPPAQTLLTYAAYGWAARRRWLAKSGRPLLPERKEWAAELGALLGTPEGLDELRALTESGMAAWAVDPSIIAVVAPAFASATLRQHLATLLSPWRPPRPAADSLAPVLDLDTRAPTPAATAADTGNHPPRQLLRRHWPRPR